MSDLEIKKLEIKHTELLIKYTELQIQLEQIRCSNQSGGVEKTDPDTTEFTAINGDIMAVDKKTKEVLSLRVDDGDKQVAGQQDIDEYTKNLLSQPVHTIQVTHL